MNVIQKTPEKLIVRMDDNYPLANALRRSVEEIETLAIEEVEFFKNDSALYDEFLAHRLGLVPLKTENKMGKKTEISMKLKKSGPGTVYSGDLSGNAKVVYDKIPLTILEKGQEIELVATATLGTGLTHAKHVPGLCYYRYILDVASTSEIDSIVQAAQSAIKPEKQGKRWICDLPEAAVDEIQKIDATAVKETNELLFFIESFGHLDADAILQRALGVLTENVTLFEKSLG